MKMSCAQEKVFFFLSHIWKKKLTWKGGIMLFPQSGRPHRRHTEDDKWVGVSECVWEWCTTEGHRATPTHQSHNHTLTTNRGRKRKTSHGYIKYNITYTKHTGIPPGWNISAEFTVKFTLASIPLSFCCILYVKQIFLTFNTLYLIRNVIVIKSETILILIVRTEHR